MVNWWWEHAHWTLPDSQALEDFSVFTFIHRQLWTEGWSFGGCCRVELDISGCCESPVRSSTGSGFPIVLKERTLLSNVRNHHQPSCALVFYDVTLCAANLVDSTCLKKGILRKNESWQRKGCCFCIDRIAVVLNFGYPKRLICGVERERGSRSDFINNWEELSVKVNEICGYWYLQIYTFHLLPMYALSFGP